MSEFYSLAHGAVYSASVAFGLRDVGSMPMDKHLSDDYSMYVMNFALCLG